jgi:heme/copper-type cytochrome/quinol oxidase subunit 3
MSTTVNIHERTGQKVITAVDDGRGTLAMWQVIATEAALFVTLFSAYFFIGNNKNRWAIDHPPKLHYSLIMLGVMVVSCFVLFWGERLVRVQNYIAARIALAITFLLGLVFLTLQSFAYLEHWKTLTPYSDSYGSIYYTITFFHDAHVVVGLLILAYVLCLPRYGPVVRTPYRPYRVAALYWYFVTIVLFFVVLILTIIPNGKVYGI